MGREKSPSLRHRADRVAQADSPPPDLAAHVVGRAAAVVVAAAPCGRRAKPRRLRAHSDPARASDGRGAPTLVVEGWLDERELDDAIAPAPRPLPTRRHLRRADRKLARGPAMAELCRARAEHLRRHGAAIDSGRRAAGRRAANERTYLSALVVRDWLRSQGIARRGRRSLLGRSPRAAFAARLPDRVRPRRRDRHPRRAAAPLRLERWWETSEGAKAVLGELLGLAWTKCCFWARAHISPPGQAAHKPPA